MHPTGYTLSTLYSMGKKYRAHNFPDLCERAWGTKGSSIASVIIFVYNWYGLVYVFVSVYASRCSGMLTLTRGNLVAGLLIVGSSLPSLLRALFCAVLQTLSALTPHIVRHTRVYTRLCTPTQTLLTSPHSVGQCVDQPGLRAHVGRAHSPPLLLLAQHLLLCNQLNHCVRLPLGRHRLGRTC